MVGPYALHMLYTCIELPKLMKSNFKHKLSMKMLSESYRTQKFRPSQEGVENHKSDRRRKGQLGKCPGWWLLEFKESVADDSSSKQRAFEDGMNQTGLMCKATYENVGTWKGRKLRTCSVHKGLWLILAVTS